MSKDRNINLAYIAGFVDGEGCFSVAKTSALLPLLSIGQRNRHVLDVIQGYTGVGRISTTSTRKLWRYAVSGQPCLDLVEDLVPFLILKREEAETLLMFPMVGQGTSLTPKTLDKRWEVHHKLREIRSARKARD